jgi:hypothetical protein
MARKNKKKRDGSSTADEILDDILGADEDEDEGEGSTSIGTDDEKDEREADEREADEGTPVEGLPPTQDREEAGEDGGSEDLQGSEDPPPSADSTEVELDATPAEKEKQGLLKEISELRQKINETKRPAASPPPVMPMAPPPAATTALPSNERVPGHVPVLVSEDGQSVYNDPDAFREEVESTARRMIQEANTPSPEQLKAMATQKSVDDFVALDPGRNQPLADRAQQADDYIVLHVQKLVGEGHQFTSVADVTNTLKAQGIDKNVTQHFPEIEGMFDEFVAGRTSGDPVWRRSLLDRMAPRGEAPKVNDPVTPSVEGLPRSMSKKGGTKTGSMTTDESEFEFLNTEFQENVVFFDDKKFERLEELGARLEKPGFG